VGRGGPTLVTVSDARAMDVARARDNVRRALQVAGIAFPR
jgi:hypothetical protein